MTVRKEDALRAGSASGTPATGVADASTKLELMPRVHVQCPVCEGNPWQTRFHDRIELECECSHRWTIELDGSIGEVF